MRETEEAEAVELSDRFRISLSEWLTAPVRFDETILTAISILGEPMSVETRWGREIHIAYQEALGAAQELATIENPVRANLRVIIRDLRAAGKTFKIACHRRSRPHYESIFNSEDAPLESDAFIQTPTEYRQAEPFSVLVKVGPLRSRGWGAVLDAVLTAPRFDAMIQIVWSGSNDEEGFGYDPVIVAAKTARAESGQAETEASGGADFTWRRKTIPPPDDDLQERRWLDDMDEFHVFKDLGRTSDFRRVSLVQIDDDHGILYPANSSLLSLDPKASIDPISRRRLGENLTEGLFLVWPIFSDIQFGGLKIGDGNYSRMWKERLREEVSRDTYGFLERLRRAGVDLLNLRACVDLWCRPPSNVIHAPQKRSHFETLIDLLGIDFEDRPSRSARLPWARYAWAEIAHARGEAIQTGLQEHEIVEEELLRILSELSEQIRVESAVGHNFAVELPSTQPLSGKINFYKIVSIEEGFLSPESAIKSISDLNTIEQWRA